MRHQLMSRSVQNSPNVSILMIRLGRQTVSIRIDWGRPYWIVGLVVSCHLFPSLLPLPLSYSQPLHLLSPSQPAPLRLRPKSRLCRAPSVSQPHKPNIHQPASIASWPSTTISIRSKTVFSSSLYATGPCFTLTMEITRSLHGTSNNSGHARVGPAVAGQKRQSAPLHLLWSAVKKPLPLTSFLR